MDLTMNAEFDEATNHTVMSGINIGNGKGLGLWNITHIDFTLASGEAAAPLLTFNDDDDLLRSG